MTPDRSQYDEPLRAAAAFGEIARAVSDRAADLVREVLPPREVVPAAVLAGVRALRLMLTEAVFRAVMLAKADGAPWEDIGLVLGMSPETAGAEAEQVYGADWARWSEGHEQPWLPVIDGTVMTNALLTPPSPDAATALGALSAWLTRRDAAANVCPGCGGRQEGPEEAPAG